MTKLNLVKTFPENVQGRKVQVCESSGVLDAGNHALLTEAGVLVDVVVYTNGFDDATLTVYDNASAATGKVLAMAKVKGADLMAGEVNIFCAAANGLYLTLTGTGAQVLVRFIA